MLNQILLITVEKSITNMSNSFCHFIGYRMRIGNNTDAPNTGRLHVDYALARQDQYEYECKQRALLREARHRDKMEKDKTRPLSPPPVPHYTDHEAGNISETIKSKSPRTTINIFLEKSR